MNRVFKKYLFYFFVFAIFGFIWEVVVNLILHHKLVNSGTLIGPWLPIYGWGLIFSLLLSKKIKNNYILFPSLFFLFGIVEYLTSLYLEYFYHTKWWDYSRYLLNINGRVCVEGLLLFSLIALFIIRIIVPKIDKIYEKINTNLLTVILYILLSIYIVDYIYCTIKPNKDNYSIDNIIKEKI